MSCKKTFFLIERKNLAHKKQNRNYTMVSQLKLNILFSRVLKIVYCSLLLVGFLLKMLPFWSRLILISVSGSGKDSFKMLEMRSLVMTKNCL